MFLTCDITSCSTQSCTLSLSCKINLSHETSLPGQVKVQKVQYDGQPGGLLHDSKGVASQRIISTQKSQETLHA